MPTSWLVSQKRAPRKTKRKIPKLLASYVIEKHYSWGHCCNASRAAQLQKWHKTFVFGGHALSASPLKQHRNMIHHLMFESRIWTHARTFFETEIVEPKNPWLWPLTSGQSATSPNVLQKSYGRSLICPMFPHTSCQSWQKLIPITKDPFLNSKTMSSKKWNIFSVKHFWEIHFKGQSTIGNLYT